MPRGGKDASKDQSTRESLAPIFRFHKAVRSVSLIGMDGTLLYSIMKEGLKHLEPEQLVPDVLLKFALAKGMTEAQEEYHGGLKSIAMSREKVRHLAYPKTDKLLVVSTDPGFPMERIDALGKLVAKLKVE